MAMEYGGSAILNGWEEYQELKPGKSFFDFEKWFVSTLDMEHEDKTELGNSAEGENDDKVSVSTVRQERSYDVELF